MKAPYYFVKRKFILYLFLGLGFFTSGCEKYQNNSDNEEGFFLLSGYVLEAGSGSPVKGAKVIAYADAGTFETERKSDNAFSKTDSKGRFSMKVYCDPVGMYESPYFCFYVEHPDYQAAVKGFNYSSGVKIYLTRIK
ncbi:MAG: carboxypeptidase-like regulatory domain-containing protein [Bacteroidia bacterium]|nr:carboxypeptidase-like regulatory domain-containing protein [Bacteroidia bacterium]